MRRYLIVLLAAFVVVWVYSRANALPSLCAFTGNITQIYGLIGGSPGAGVRVSYKGIVTQNSSGSIIPGGSQCSVTTDVNGNLPTSGTCTSFIQGVLMNVTIGRGQPVQIQVPLASSADLSTLYIANNTPPSLVEGLAIARGGDYGLTISASPSPGALGTIILQPGNVTAMHITGGTPTAWPLDFSGTQVLLGNNTPLPFPTGAGMITVTDTTSTGTTAIYVCGGGACVMAAASKSVTGFESEPANSSPSPGFAAIIYTGNPQLYTLITNFATPITFGIALLRTRNVP